MGQTSTPKARMARWMVIFLHLFLLTIISSSSYAQTKTFATTATVISNTVVDKDNATRDDETYASVRSNGGTLGIGKLTGELRLTFDQDVPANRTTFIRIGYDTGVLNSLLGGNLGSSLAGLVGSLVLGNHYFTVGARSADGTNVISGSSNGSFSNTNIKLVRDVQGNYYLAVAPNFAYRSVFIRDVTNAFLLGGPNEIRVFNAFHVSGTGNCDPPIATDFEGTGATLDLLGLTGAGVTDIQNAIDGNPASFSKASLGVIALAGTISQNVYYSTPSRLGDEFNVRLSVSQALANVGLLSNITVEAYDGNEIVSSRTGVGGLLNLDLLGLLNSGQPVTIPFTVPATRTFDRVKVTLSSVLGVSLVQTLNIHEVTRSAPRPTFTAPLSNALNICYNTTATLGATTDPSNQLVWYDVQDGGTALATTAYNGTYTTPQPLTSNKTFYVAARQIGCTAESVRVPITVTVNPAINFAATTLANGTIGTAYNKQLTAATGGTAGYTYTVAVGSTLPAGLSLSTTGTLAGMPTLAGPYNFSVTVTDSKGCTATTPHTLIITDKLTLGNLTLPDGTVGISYSQIVPVATGGTPNYNYSVTNLPPGLQFNATTMTIEGNPSTAGSYVVTVSVSDQDGNTASMNYPIIIRNSLALPNATLANGTVGTAYPTQTIPEATGGTPGYTYSVTGGLPPGLQFNNTTREITGNPITAGNYTVNVQVTDGAGTTITNSYAIRVVDPLVLANKTLVEGTAGVTYPGDVLPVATGGSGSYTYAVTNLPAGLSFDQTTRQISGTAPSAGNYTITLTVTDSEQRTATNTYVLKVNGALTLATAALPDGTVGTVYPPQTLPAVSGGTLGYTYEAIGLPSWLNFDATNRVVSGTPTVGGTYTFKIKASDAASNTVTTDYQIKVNVTAPVVASVVICAGTSATLSVSNTQTGVTYNWYGASGSTALATNNNGTFNTGNITSNTVFYVEAVSGTAVSTRVAVNVTTNPAPAAAVIATNNQTVNPNQSTIVRANVAAGNTVRWYDSATGGTNLGTGEELATGNLTVNTIFYAEAVSAQGCASLTRTPAIVTVVTGGGADCTAANAESSGISSLLCLLCGVSNSGNSVDADKNNYTRITLTVGAAATGFQRLVFPSTGLATDSIRLDLGLPGGLLDLSVLGDITVNVMKNNAVVRTLQLNSSLVYLQLLGGNRFETTFAAGAEFDRVEVRFQAVVAALSSLDIYGAQIVYPNPTVVGNNQTICYNTSANISATANGNTQIAWYDAGGNLLANTATYATPNLTATTTYYIQVSRNGCSNSERMPITVNVVPLLDVPTVGAATITACEGSPVTLAVTNPNAAITYKWYDAATNGTELHTGATYTISNVAASRTYYVEATQQGCTSTGRASVAVTVNPRPALPQVQASVSAVTVGQTVLLTASSAESNVDFNWYASATAATPIHTGATFVTPPLSATTSYYVEARSTLTGCVSPSRVVITITVTNGTPTPTPCISPISESNGVSGIALLAGVSNPGLAIDNDTQTGSTLFLPVAALGGYVYQRFAFPEAGIVGDTVRISITSPGKLLSLGLLSSVQLSTRNAGVAGNDVVNLNNALINLELLSGGTQALLTFVPTKAFDEIEVRLNAGIVNALNSININYAQHVIAAPQITINNAEACSNSPVVLTVQNPRAGFTYRFYNEVGTFLGVGVVSASSVTFTTPGITAATKFYVTASAGADCESAGTLVNVGLKATPAAPILLSSSISTCSGSNVVIQVKDPIAGITYRWYDSANVYQMGKDGTSFTLTNVTANATYKVEAFDATCNVASAAMTTVQVNIGNLDAPIVDAANVSVSPNSRALLTATSSNPNATVRWYNASNVEVGTGNSYLTPALTANADFFAEAFDSITGCTSARTLVRVTVVTDGNTGPVPCLAATSLEGQGIEGVAVLGGVYNAGLAVDNRIETASSLVIPVGLVGSYAFQRVGFGSFSNIGDTVKVLITSPGKLLSLAVLPSISVLTYSGTTSNNDAIFANNPLIKIDLLSDGSAATLTFVPTQSFNHVELRLNSGIVSAFTSVDFNYAQRIAVAPQVDVAAVSACAGSGAVLRVRNPITGVTYRWYLENTATTTDGPTFTTPNTLAAGTYNYYVTAVINGCETSPTKVVVTILPTPAPPIPLATNPASICFGTSATLAVEQVAGVTYNWFNAAGTLVAFNSASYTTPANLTIGLHEYFVEALNANGCANTGGRVKVSITVGDRAKETDIQVSGPTTACASNQVVLTATSTTVVTNPIFRWYADAALTTLVFTGPTLTIPSITANVTYYVTVSGTEKCENAPADAKSVSITVNPPATSSDLMVSPAIERCGPGTVTLIASSSTVTNPIFTWYSDPALTIPVGTGSPFVTAVLNASQTFYVTVKGSNRCESPVSQAKSVSVTVNSIAVATDISITGNTTTCTNSSTTLTATNTTAPLISNPIFTWYSDPALTNRVFTGATFTTPALAVATTYYVTVKGSDRCENLPGNAATVTVTVSPLPEAPIVGAAGTSVCNNNSTILTVTNVQPNTIYEWYNSATNGTLLFTGNSYTTQPLNAGTTFYVRAVGTLGCTGASARVAVQVTVTTRPANPTVANSTVSTCTNGSVELAVSNPVTGVTYTWYTVGGTQVDVGSRITVSSLTTNTSYFVEASIGSCTSLARTRVDVVVGTPPSPPANVTAAAAEICAGASTVLTVNNPDLTLTYRWYTAATLGTLLHTGTTYTTSALSATTTFYVEAVAAGGNCVSATRTAVTVNVIMPLPAPVVTVGTITTNSILFTWNAVPLAISYMVSIDGGATWSTTLTTNYLASSLIQGQSVTIIVRAVGNSTCQTSANSNAVTATTSDPFKDELYIPNTFTPNNDGRNDFFLAYGNSVAKFRMRVYNQWGEFVFESQNILQGWDGTYRGRPQPTGVYVYYVDVTFNSGTDKTFKGTVTLLR